MFLHGSSLLSLLVLLSEHARTARQISIPCFPHRTGYEKNRALRTTRARPGRGAALGHGPGAPSLPVLGAQDGTKAAEAEDGPDNPSEYRDDSNDPEYAPTNEHTQEVSVLRASRRHGHLVSHQPGKTDHTNYCASPGEDQQHEGHRQANNRHREHHGKHQHSAVPEQAHCPCPHITLLQGLSNGAHLTWEQDLDQQGQSQPSDDEEHDESERPGKHTKLPALPRQ